MIAPAHLGRVAFAALLTFAVTPAAAVAQGGDPQPRLAPPPAARPVIPEPPSWPPPAAQPAAPQPPSSPPPPAAQPGAPDPAAAPPADASPADRQALRLFLSLDAEAGNAPERPDLLAGGRLAIGLQIDRPARLGTLDHVRAFGELDVDGAAGTAHTQPRFGSTVLLGPGLGVATQHLSFQASLLFGEHSVELQDYIRGGWVDERYGAIGLRLGLTARPATWGEKFQLAPTAGLALKLLWLERRTDPLRHVSWGGFSPMLTLSIGADVTGRLRETFVDAGAEAPAALQPSPPPVPPSAAAEAQPPGPAPQETQPPEPVPPRDPMAPAWGTFSLGLGTAVSAGRVGGSLGSTSDWWQRGPMPLVYLDGGIRVTPHLALVLAVDVAVGDASRSITDGCAARNLECGVAAGRVGIQARYAFTPAARHTAWVAAGTGWESADLFIDPRGTGYAMGASGSQTVSFVGWEILRLGAGGDLRLSRTWGFGLFVYGSVARFSKVVSDGPAYLVPGDLGARQAHFWLLGGARVVLFP